VRGLEQRLRGVEEKRQNEAAYIGHSETDCVRLKRVGEKMR